MAFHSSLVGTRKSDYIESENGIQRKSQLTLRKLPSFVVKSKTDIPDHLRNTNALKGAEMDSCIKIREKQSNSEVTRISKEMNGSRFVRILCTVLVRGKISCEKEYIIFLEKVLI
jgi:hypothetical protein